MNIEIQELLVKADELATARDVKGYLELFDEKGKIVFKDQVIEYPKLEEFIKETWAEEPYGTVHLTLNPQIIGETKTQAVCRTRMMIVETKTNKIVSLSQVEHTLKWVDHTWIYEERHVL